MSSQPGGAMRSFITAILAALLLLSVGGCDREKDRAIRDAIRTSRAAAKSGTSKPSASSVPSAKASSHTGKQDTSLLAIGKKDAVKWKLCFKSTIYVVDGDTFYCGNRRNKSNKYRLLGADTPESRKTGKYAEEGQEPWGGKATALVKTLISQAEKVYILSANAKGGKGRHLAHMLLVNPDGKQKLLALELVAAKPDSLAYELCTKYGDNGFATFCRMIKEADKNVKKKGPRKFVHPICYKHPDSTDKLCAGR